MKPEEEGVYFIVPREYSPSMEERQTADRSMKPTGHIIFALRKQRRMKRKCGWPIAMEPQNVPAITHFLQ